MKISYGESIISPDIGTPIAGYGLHDVSITKLDDLYLSALALDDGQKKIVMAYELIRPQCFERTPILKKQTHNHKEKTQWERDFSR